MGQVFLISSGKGGVGKSTVCKHIANRLSSSKVLVIEACSGYRSVDLMLNVADKIVYDIKDLLERRVSFQTAVLRCPTNIDFLPATPDCDYSPGERELANLIIATKQTYDFTIIDCAAGFTDWHRVLAPLVDVAVVVTTPSDIAVRDAAQNALQLLKSGARKQRLIINRIPKKPAQLNIPDLDYAIDTIGAQLLGAIPECKVEKHMLTSTSLWAIENIADRLCGQRVELLVK